MHRPFCHDHGGVHRDFERDVVVRHHHLGAGSQLRRACNIDSEEVELRAVTFKERRMPPALFLAQHLAHTREVKSPFSALDRRACFINTYGV